MHHCVRVGTDRSQVLNGIHLIALIDPRDRNEMVNVNVAGPNVPIPDLKRQQANQAHRPVVPYARLPSGAVALKDIY